MELVRLSIEVLYGDRAAYKALDFESEKAKIRVEGTVHDLLFYREDNIESAHFTIEGDVCVAHLNNNVVPEQVRVVRWHKPYFIRGHEMWVIGTSFADRWYEPISPDDFRVTFYKRRYLLSGHTPLQYYVNGDPVGCLIYRSSKWLTPDEEYGTDDHKAIWRYAARRAEVEFPGGNTRALRRK